MTLAEMFRNEKIACSVSAELVWERAAEMAERYEKAQLALSVRLKYLYARKDIFQEVKDRAKAMNPARTTAEDYYDAWRDLIQENELAIGIEERRAAGGRDEV